ncbi:MAG: hypothetical protein KUG79_08585 [Pseudomonadales bacterium]|nr:hypothetical protein [Pseudomonadales bacterium]
MDSLKRDLRFKSAIHKMNNLEVSNLNVPNIANKMQCLFSSVNIGALEQLQVWFRSQAGKSKRIAPLPDEIIFEDAPAKSLRRRSTKRIPGKLMSDTALES